MNKEADKTIGIVGGMGPEAGIALFNRIISHTPAGMDQEHLPVMLMSFPGRIADRTAFLEGTVGTNPAYAVAEIIRKLESAGARTIGIACNTSHAPGIFDVILEELDRMDSQAQLLNMPFETCRFVREKHPHIRRVGFMVTNGAYRSRLYENLLSESGYEAVVPDPAFQQKVIHPMVYDPVFGIKANPGKITPEAGGLMQQALDFFKTKATEAVILGCTELSLIPRAAGPDDPPVIDSMEALARALIREAAYPLNENERSCIKTERFSVAK